MMVATHYVHAYWWACNRLLSIHCLRSTRGAGLTRTGPIWDLKAKQGLQFFYQYRLELMAYHLYCSTMSYSIFLEICFQT